MRHVSQSSSKGATCDRSGGCRGGPRVAARPNGRRGWRAVRPGRRPPPRTPRRPGGGKSGGREPGTGGRGRRRLERIHCPSGRCSSPFGVVQSRGPGKPRRAGPDDHSQRWRNGVLPRSGSRVGPVHGAGASLSSSLAVETTSVIRMAGAAGLHAPPRHSGCRRSAGQAVRRTSLESSFLWCFDRWVIKNRASRGRRRGGARSAPGPGRQSVLSGRLLGGVGGADRAPGSGAARRCGRAASCVRTQRGVAQGVPWHRGNQTFISRSASLR